VNKKLFCSLMQSSVLAASLLCAAQGFAQETGAPPEGAAPPPSGQGMGGRRGMMDPDQQLARMTQRYNLSTDQQTQIKPILASAQQQVEALRGDSSMSRDDKMAKMMTIRTDSRAKIGAILNPDQKKQFDADQQKMQDRMQHGGPGGPGGPPPPPQ
jgi:periplasmic protein CpxP/Spy